MIQELNKDEEYCSVCKKYIGPDVFRVYTKTHGLMHYSCAPDDLGIPALTQGLMKDAKPHDPVNHPKHYTSHPSGIECIEVTRHMNFNCGNAVKYLWRATIQDATIQDLEKAAWYIQDEIKRLKKLQL